MDARKRSAKWRNWNISNFLLLEFYRETKAVEEARNICAVYGEIAIGESMAKKLFSRFKEDRFDISDTPCSGRHLGFD